MGGNMRIDDSLRETEVLNELSRRFRQYRISYPLTQSELAEKSMVSLSTVKRFENGEDIGLIKLLQLMRALDIQEHLEVLIPDPSVRPSAYLEKECSRQRARKKKPRAGTWKWGDEE